MGWDCNSVAECFCVMLKAQSSFQCGRKQTLSIASGSLAWLVAVLGPQCNSDTETAFVFKYSLTLASGRLFN